ncbi:hypothetical protein CAPTEDRAFT_188815 [Capitella teleta]|uniref:Uncharacterized protein n=1 Tax=Capitella teleta TaxID=283909 RepID=R7VEC8_CAPTE|nr:hypothetical protein CAPTEDRAFT_188815 [Capitella teleta]|eukprot:ELU16937.1 hypothetical protein CAPTEDRAFT_188815 [Capitella teleta]
MKAILLIVLLRSAIAQQSEEEADRRVSRLEVRLGHLEQAIQVIGQQSAAMEGRMEAQTSMVRDFNQLHLELLDRDARAMESQLLEIRQIVQSAVDHLSAMEERIATANAATEDRLTSNHAVLSENMTSLMTDFTEHLTAEMDNRINDLENRTRGEYDLFINEE